MFECPYSSKAGEGKGKEVLGDKEVGALFSEIFAPYPFSTSPDDDTDLTNNPKIPSSVHLSMVHFLS